MADLLGFYFLSSSFYFLLYTPVVYEQALYFWMKKIRQLEAALAELKPNV